MKIELRKLQPEDKAELSEQIYCAMNVWYTQHGRPPTWTGGPSVTEPFYDVYEDLSPGCNVIAVNSETGRIIGSCFYHPREHHVSLGIMSVHPNYWGSGAGSAMMRHIIQYTESNGYEALRLTSSAINLDSFTLYAKYGFIGHYNYIDILLTVPDSGIAPAPPGADRVRPATLDDVDEMARLEFELSGICRTVDYKYFIENKRGYLQANVVESQGSGIDGFMLSSDSPAMNILGPSVARDEEAAAALIFDGLNRNRGKTPWFLIPMEKRGLVDQVLAWGGRICETHYCQVRGEYQPYKGVNLPSFLPESG